MGMVSYIKHIPQLMRRAGAENTQENKDMLDSIIRDVLSMHSCDSSEVWEKVKSIMYGGNLAAKKEFEDKVVKIFIKKLIAG